MQVEYKTDPEAQKYSQDVCFASILGKTNKFYFRLKYSNSRAPAQTYETMQECLTYLKKEEWFNDACTNLDITWEFDDSSVTGTFQGQQEAYKRKLFLLTIIRAVVEEYRLGIRMLPLLKKGIPYLNAYYIGTQLGNVNMMDIHHITSPGYNTIYTPKKDFFDSYIDYKKLCKILPTWTKEVTAILPEIVVKDKVDEFKDYLPNKSLIEMVKEIAGEDFELV